MGVESFFDENIIYFASKLCIITNYIDKIWANSEGVVMGVEKFFGEKIIYFDSKRCKITNYIDKIWTNSEGVVMGGDFERVGQKSRNYI